MPPRAVLRLEKNGPDEQASDAASVTITRKRGKAERVARPACANTTVHSYLPTDWLRYCRLANDL